ncbi:hypothetical protein B9G55_15045 [Saccharibacillus sp. O16]|nr:hypothetical protein B9G55_15045 [Saccharibacillus sp. O16]
MKKWMMTIAASAVCFFALQTSDAQASPRFALLDNVLKGAVDAADQTVGSVSDSVNQTLDGATGALEQTVNGTLNQTQQLVQETVDTAGQTAGGLLEPVTQPTVDTVNQVVDTVEQVVKDGTVITNKVADVPLQALPETTGALNGKAADPVGTLIQETGQAVKAVEQTVKNTTQHAGSVVGGVSGVVEGTREIVETVVHQTVKPIANPGGGGTPPVPAIPTPIPMPTKPVPAPVIPAPPASGQTPDGGEPGSTASGKQEAGSGGQHAVNPESGDASVAAPINNLSSTVVGLVVDDDRQPVLTPVLSQTQPEIEADAASAAESVQNVSIATVEPIDLDIPMEEAETSDLVQPGTPIDKGSLIPNDSILRESMIGRRDPVQPTPTLGQEAPDQAQLTEADAPVKTLPMPLLPRQDRRPLVPQIVGILGENAPNRTASGSSSQGGAGSGSSPLPIAQLYTGYAPTALAPLYRLKHASNTEGSQWINAPPFSPPKQAPFLT